MTDNELTNSLKFKNNIKGTLILLITAMIWGASFVSQSAGADILGPNSFNGIRMLLGSAVLMPVCLIVSKTQKKSRRKPADKKKLFSVGAVCGIALCAASTVQTWGITFTTAGKSGFITAMYIIFVPIISILIGKKISAKTLVCAVIAIAGMYLLSVAGNESGINIGDALTLLCAVFFAIHIILVDKYALEINPIYFSCIQFFVCGVINIILMFIFERPTLEMIKACAVPILYSGVMSCGVAYTLQPFGQRFADPSAASIVMSLESVFAMLFGAILPPNNIPSAIEICGCVIMFVAIVLSQMPDNFLKPLGSKSAAKQHESTVK